jgi:hypothetical protein
VLIWNEYMDPVLGCWYCVSVGCTAGVLVILIVSISKTKSSHRNRIHLNMELFDNDTRCE